MPDAEWTRGPVTVCFGENHGKYPDGNQVIVRGRDATAVFDTPLSAPRWAQRLRAADVAILGHVHEDHVCGLDLIPDTPLYAPRADREAVASMEGMLRHYGYSAETSRAMREALPERYRFFPRPDAMAYDDGAVWELGGVRVRAVHLPGHTGGHSALVVEPQGIAFIGDIDLSGFGPYYGDACSHLDTFLDSLQRIRHLEARTWITSHHKGVIEERDTFLALLERFEGRIYRREEAICAELARAPRTVAELVAHRFLYPAGYRDIFVENAERRTITQHLERLAARGRAVAEAGRWRLAAGRVRAR